MSCELDTVDTVGTVGTVGTVDTVDAVDTVDGQLSGNAIVTAVEGMATIETVVQTADPRAHMSENAVRVLLSLAQEFNGAFILLEVTEEDFFQIFEEENQDTDEDAEDFRVFEASKG